jgi:hypothetical protein
MVNYQRSKIAMDLSTYNRNNAEQRTQPNNPIPPRSRALCCADSPRRGEYGALCTPPGGISNK